jgi:hypothetical protein
MPAISNGFVLQNVSGPRASGPSPLGDPWGGREVHAYLARYTHRVAISNHRLLAVDDKGVTFSWRDYRDGARMKSMTLAADEFIRRFLLHVLPDSFQRVRHYGFFATGVAVPSSCLSVACSRQRRLRLPTR